MTDPAFNRQIVKLCMLAKLAHAKYGTSRNEQLSPGCGCSLRSAFIASVS